MSILKNYRLIKAASFLERLKEGLGDTSNLNTNLPAMLAAGGGLAGGLEGALGGDDEIEDGVDAHGKPIYRKRDLSDRLMRGLGHGIGGAALLGLPGLAYSAYQNGKVTPKAQAAAKAYGAETKALHNADTQAQLSSNTSGGLPGYSQDEVNTASKLAEPNAQKAHFDKQLEPFIKEIEKKQQGIKQDLANQSAGQHAAAGIGDGAGSYVGKPLPQQPSDPAEGLKYDTSQQDIKRMAEELQKQRGIK